MSQNFPPAVTNIVKTAAYDNVWAPANPRGGGVWAEEQQEETKVFRDGSLAPHLIALNQEGRTVSRQLSLPSSLDVGSQPPNVANRKIDARPLHPRTHGNKRSGHVSAHRLADCDNDGQIVPQPLTQPMGLETGQ